MLLLACASPAGALVPEAFDFGSEGERSGQFVEPAGIALAQDTGDAYVIDVNNLRGERWGALGEFRDAWGWGVTDGSTAALQTCEATCVKGLPGAGAGQLGERFSGISGIAVDNSLSLSHGDVYVVDSRNHRVEKYGPAGEFLLMFGGDVNATTHSNICLSGEACQTGKPGPGPGEFGPLAGEDITVDAAGTVYVGDADRVQRFTPAGAVEGEIPLPGSGGILALAVDSAKDIYVASTAVSGVRKFDPAGVELGTARDTGGGQGRLIAVGPHDELFVEEPEEAHIMRFSAEGEETLRLAEPGGGAGIAVATETERLYVVHSDHVHARTLPPAGPVLVEGSEKAAAVEPASALLEASIDPEGAEPTTYHFQYGETAAYGVSTPDQALEAEPFEDHPVSAQLAGLTPRTTYHYRVVATNAKNQTTFGPDETFTTLPPVGLDNEAATQVTQRSAKLTARINAHGLPTTYHFDYGTTTAYENHVPEPDATVGSGSGGAPVEVLIEALQPGTKYHYRLIATNSLGTVEGPDHVFQTQPQEQRTLLDGREWQLVSPANKHGVALDPATLEGGVIQAAADGSRLAYIAKAPIDTEPPGNRTLAETQLIARRTPSGWSTSDIATEHEGVVGLHLGELSEYRLFSSDLSFGFVEPEGATPLSQLTSGAPTPTERTPYRGTLEGCASPEPWCYAPLVNRSNTLPAAKFGGEETRPEQFFGGVSFVDATPDAAHALLYTPVQLTEELSVSQGSLYEWSAGSLQLVSVLPNGESTSEQGLSAPAGNQGLIVRHVLSADGRRVIFETQSAIEANLHLYSRDVLRGETVQLDAPVEGAPGGHGEARFQDASSDGTKVYFTDGARLTADSTAAPESPDLYLCEIAVSSGHDVCTLTDVTVDGNERERAGVQGAVIGTDTAGRYVYFAANGALAPGAIKGNCTAGGPIEVREGSLCNIYVFDSVAHTLRLVAVVSGKDGADWGSKANGLNLGSVTSRVSPNGRYLAFMSQRSLTGFDNHDAAAEAQDEEVYLFDAGDETLTCASCARTGERPEGVLEPHTTPGLMVDHPSLWPEQHLAASVPSWTHASLSKSLYQPRYLSDEGRLFFDSAVSLTSKDTNAAEDVYEYEPFGVGGPSGCDRSPGCVALISSGEASDESVLLDASENGNDVFFLTTARLTGEDRDGALDVYTAHVCAAAAPCSPGQTAVPEPCSTIDSCRATSPPQPTFGVPASVTGAAGGNVTTTPPKHASVSSRAQQLARALKACARRPRSRRKRCRAEARRRYRATGARRHPGDLTPHAAASNRNTGARR